jgi:hypothetical protein
MADDQVTPPGNQDQNSNLGWRSALPDEFKEHEFVKTFQKPGDFVKTAIEIKADRDALKSKVENSIPKLAADSTDEEKAVYYQSLGRPEKADGYEFDGGTLDEKTAKWARDAFFAAGLSKDQGKAISASWNGFVKQMVDADVAQRTEERTKAETQLKSELGDKYDGSIELVRRVWKKHTSAEFDSFVNETKIGNDPRMIRFMLAIAKATGEDTSPAGSPSHEKRGTPDATAFYAATAVKKP